jgi:PmbA protein
MGNEKMLETARQAVKLALAKGANEAAATASVDREVEVRFRDGKLDKISEATKRGVSMKLYVDGRYSNGSTSDLRPEALETFLDNAIALTKTLAKDPFRTLPDPALYKGQATADLVLADPKYDALTAEDRRKIAADLEAAARGVKGSEAIISVTGVCSDSSSESFQVHSNGFEGSMRKTYYDLVTEVSVKDKDDRRPEDYAYAAARFFSELPKAEEIGREAAERTLGRLGSKKAPSAVLPMVLDNRSSGRLLSYMMRALSGSSLQQKRSFLEGKLGSVIGSPRLDVVEDPLVPKGFGSRLYDGEGIAAKRFPLFAGGVLKSYYIDTYYGKKLQVAPTTSGMSNLTWKLGDKSMAALIADIKDGFLVTGFLGGNSNDTTGDFSLGVQGYAIRGGKRAEPVAEMNISGNHLDFWKRLAAVGNDPYPYSPSRVPTLVFDGVQFAGS